MYISAVNSALIILTNIYADSFGDRQDTRVYNNGVMQVSVFVSVNYNGEGASENEIIKYVQDNVVIYSLNYEENVQWTQSIYDNGYLHDLDHDSNKNASVLPKALSDIRARLFFTVPGGSAEGEHNWIAKLGDKQTNSNTPLTVTVESFEVSGDDLEIVDKASVNCAVLRVLKYKKDKFPSTQKMKQSVEFKGLNFYITGGNTRISMAMSTKGHKLGGFLEYLESSVSSCQHDAIILCDCLDNTLNFYPTDVEDAWNAGIVMVLVHDMSLQLGCTEYSGAPGAKLTNFETNNFLLEDTFGGMVEVNINWDVSDWWGNWAVKSAQVVYPWK